MKKLIAVFLCLIFVLPLAVHAQEAEPQTREADPQPPEHTHSWNTETVIGSRALIGVVGWIILRFQKLPSEITA